MREIGDVVPCTDGTWMTIAPTHCPNGHQLAPGRTFVGHQPCSCGGHTTWRCECDAVVYGPRLSAGCTPLAGPARVVEL